MLIFALMRQSWQNEPLAQENPGYGDTTAASDKSFKVAEHRRERRQAKVRLANGGEPQASKVFGNPWHSEKDGKSYRSNPDVRDLRK